MEGREGLMVKSSVIHKAWQTKKGTFWGTIYTCCRTMAVASLSKAPKGKPSFTQNTSQHKYMSVCLCFGFVFVSGCPAARPSVRVLCFVTNQSAIQVHVGSIIVTTRSRLAEARRGEAKADSIFGDLAFND
jgi:hypothetical protein